MPASSFTLLGPFGCGKTKLLWLIAGFDVTDAGSMLLDEAVTVLDPMVVKGLPHPDLAHQFTDFMLGDRISADLTNILGSDGSRTAANP